MPFIAVDEKADESLFVEADIITFPISTKMKQTEYEELNGLKNFLFCVDKYYKGFEQGATLERLFNSLEELELIYDYNKNLKLMGNSRVPCENIEKDEDLENEFYALAYAYCRFYHQSECKQSKRINSYVKRMIEKPKK